MQTTTQKDRRIDIRVKTKQKSLLNYAARILEMKLSTFVLTSALKEAETVVADKAHFSLPKKQWDAFCLALDRPAREIPQLKQLFSGHAPLKK